MTPGKRLKLIRNDMGFTQEEFAKRLGMVGFQIRDIESGKVELSTPMAKLLQFEFMISEKWLLEGQEPAMFIDAVITEKDKMLYTLQDFVFVPQVSGEISAGGGLVADNTIEMKIAFRKEWIERRGDPRNMSLIRVSGDSMEPTLQSGDLVLVDHGRNFIDPQGGIYAIAMDDTIMIKRLQLIYPSKTLKIISDNSRYEPLETVTDQVRINGKVIWFGRELER